MATRLGWFGTVLGARVIRMLGIDYPQRPALEFIAGTGATIGVADDGVEAIQVTISATGGGGGATPGGSDNSVQYKSGTNLAGGLLKTDGTYLSFGATPSVTGAVRLTNAQAIVSRNFAGTTDINVISSDSSNRVLVGDTIGSGGVNVLTPNAAEHRLWSSSTQRLTLAETVATFGVPVAMGSQWFTFGGSGGASSGLLRLKSTSNYDVLVIDNGAGANRTPLIQVASPFFNIGIQDFNTTLTGAALSLIAQSSDVTLTAGSLFKATASGLSVIDTGSGTIFLGVTSAGNNKFTNVKIAPSTAVMVGAPVGGDASANTPFSWAANTVPGVAGGGTVTMTAAQYACPDITCSPGAANQAWVINGAPTGAGRFYLVSNESGFQVTFMGVVIANGITSLIKYSPLASAWKKAS